MPQSWYPDADRSILSSDRDCHVFRDSIYKSVNMAHLLLRVGTIPPPAPGGKSTLKIRVLEPAKQEPEERCRYLPEKMGGRICYLKGRRVNHSEDFQYNFKSALFVLCILFNDLAFRDGTRSAVSTALN